MNISFNRHHILILFFCSLLVVAGCSRSESRDPLQRKNRQEDTVDRSAENVTDKAIESAISVHSPPASGTPTPNSGKALKPALSLRTDRLFDFPVFDERRRFQRLEDEVQKISDSLNKIIPVINSQLQNKEKLENVLNKLNVLALRAEKQGLQARGPPGPDTQEVFERPPDRPPDKQPPDRPPDEVPRLITVHAMRMAEYPDKLRIVFDCSDSPDFETKIEGHALFLTLTKSELKKGISESRLKNSHLSQNPIFGEPNFGSPEISFMLKKPIKEVETLALKPNKDSPHYRLVFDIIFKQ